MILKTGEQPALMQMEKINQYTRRSLTVDEVFCFQVVLCDNDIDRDHECFTPDALHELSALFLGKTGIFDHDPKGQNQTARIYDTSVVVETDPEKTTIHGQPYTYLLAQAYAVRSVKNEDFILEIDAGIKKEVSVGCSVSHISCSVCGTNWKKKNCKHTKGADYGGKRCYGILSEPTDAYEWSFVAVPSQKNAGVTKHFRTLACPPACDLQQESSTGVARLDEEKVHCPHTAAEWIQKLAKTSAGVEGDLGGVNLSADEVYKLRDYLSKVDAQTARANNTIEQMRARVKRFSAFSCRTVPTDLVASVVEKMNFYELTAFDEAYHQQTKGLQLHPSRLPGVKAQNNPFKM